MGSTRDTKRIEEGTQKWWRFFGTVFSLRDKISFRSDGVVALRPRLRRMLDCKYVWVERVTTSGLKERKRYWLPRMLSSEWLIVIHGRPVWKSGWEAIRPETYQEDPPESIFKRGIEELLECIRYSNSRYYKTSYAELLKHIAKQRKKRELRGRHRHLNL